MPSIKIHVKQKPTFFLAAAERKYLHNTHSAMFPELYKYYVYLSIA